MAMHKAWAAQKGQQKRPWVWIRSRVQIVSIFSALLLATGFAGAQITGPVTTPPPTVVYIPGLITVAGNGTAGHTGTGGTGLATAAELQGPEGGAFDAAGNMYIADATAFAVYKVAAGTGIISIVAGTPGTEGGGCPNGTAATACSIDDPYGVAVDAAGNVYISDPNYNIVRVVSAATGNISTFAGIIATTPNTAGSPQYGGDTGPATAASLYFPTDLMMDAARQNLYIADSKNGAVRKVNVSTGIITDVAGVEGHTCASGTVTVAAGTCGDGGQALSANLSSSTYGIYFDASGNLYIADTRTYRIRKVTVATGIITSVAGSGLTGTLVTPYAGPANGDWGPALSANLVFPQRVAVDSIGAVYAVDSSDNEIRRTDPVTGVITNYLGNGNSAGTGTSFAATTPGNKVNGPVGAWYDSLGFMYFADRNTAVIRKVIPMPQFAATSVGASSSVQNEYFSTYNTDTFTSSGVTSSYKDFTSGTLSGCTLNTSEPAYNTCTIPVTFKPQLPGLRTAQISTVGGTGSFVTGVVGVGNAPTPAIFPANISSIAGNGTAGYTGDTGAATAATVNTPSGAVVDSLGNLYFADTANNAVRRVTAAGVITTIAGTGTAGYAGDKAAATSAQLSAPTAVAIDSAANIFIADTGNNVVRRIDGGTGIITTLAGLSTGVPGFSGDGGAATLAALKQPSGLAIDASGNIYIADTGNNRVRFVSEGVITTVAGNGTAGETGDNGAATAAELKSPIGLTLTQDFGIAIADTGNDVVRKYVPSTGIISLLAGTAGKNTYTGDGGAPTAATLNGPAAVAVDAAGDLYIADTGNNAVRFVYNNVITTIAGNGTAGYTGDTGLSTSAELNKPAGIAFNPSGALIIADTGSNAVRSINTLAPSITFPQQAINTTSAPQPELLVNTGNLPLTLTGLSIPAGFTQAASGGTDCTSTTTLAAGAGCIIDLEFQPTAAGTTSGTATLTDNSLNATGSKQTISLSGSGYAAPTSLSVTGLPATVSAGVVQSLTVKPLIGTATIPSFTGTIHFTSTDPKAVLPADYTYTSTDAGSHTFSVTLETAGPSYCITAADVAYSVSTQVCAAVIAGAPANITPTAGNNQTAQVNVAFSTALQATLTDAYSNPISGATVTFTPVPNAGASATFASPTATTSASGVATASTLTANSTAGSYTVTATVTGLAKSAVFNLTNSPLAVPSVTISTTPTTTAVYGQSVTLSSLVSSTGTTQPTGTVTFYDTPPGGTKAQVGTPQTASNTKAATVVDPLLSVGVNTLTASYSGDGNYSSNQATTTFNVTQATPTISGPATQPVPINAGSTASITINVNGVSVAGATPPTGGTLSYTIGVAGTVQTTTVTNGTATITIPNTQAAGNYTVQLSYGGDANYLSATGSVTIVISQQSQTISFPTVPAQTYGNNPVTLTATATSNLPVTFKLISGPGVITGSSLKLTGAGSIVVEADQGGNVAYSAAPAVQQTIVVAKAPTQTMLASSINPSATTQSVTFTATVVPGSTFPVTPTGTVTFYNGTTQLGTPVTVALVGSNYVATYTAAAASLPAGTDSITATYSGDTNFLTSTSSALSQSVNAATFSISANPTALTITNGQSGTVVLTLTSMYGYTGTLTFSCNPLPRQSYCIAATPQLPLTSNGTATETITIQTTPTTGVMDQRVPFKAGLLAIPAALLLLPLALARRRRWASLLLFFVVVAVGLGTLSGCGSTASTQTLPAGTPAGITNVVIFATDGTNTQSVPVTVTVQ